MEHKNPWDKNPQKDQDKKSQHKDDKGMGQKGGKEGHDRNNEGHTPRKF